MMRPLVLALTGLLVASPVFADPPRHAPAYGYHDQDDDRHDRRDDRKHQHAKQAQHSRETCIPGAFVCQ